MEHADQGYIVDVVAGSLRQRPLLAPSGHTAVNQAPIARQANVGSKAKAFHHAGTESLDQSVSLLHQAEYRLHGLGAFQVQRHGAPPAPQQVVFCVDRYSQTGIGCPVDTQHVSTHVGQQHRAHRRRPDARHLNYFETG